MVEVNKTLWAPRVKVKQADYEKYIKKLEDTLKVLVPKITIKKRHLKLLYITCKFDACTRYK